MKAWLLPGYSDVQSMTLADVPDPTPGPGEVVLDVQFAALNPADRYLSIGQYPGKPAFPHILGRDGVGVISAVGPDVVGMKVGETRLILRSEVGVSRPGTLAEKVAVEARYTTEVPAGWTLEQAAAAPLVYVTAWQALTQWGPLPEDAVVLVTGASGGVGVATIQLAHAMGYTLVALSRSEEKSLRLREMGATFTFDPTDKAWRDAAKSALGKRADGSPRRVDIAIDNIGGAMFNEILDVMGMNGRISVVGRLAGPVPSFNTAALFFRRLKVGGVAIATYSNEESHAAWVAVLGMLGRTGARPVVDRVFEMEQVIDAFARRAQGPMGKVVIRVGF